VQIYICFLELKKILFQISGSIFSDFKTIVFLIVKMIKNIWLCRFFDASCSISLPIRVFTGSLKTAFCHVS